jgi:hypothetical protein
VLIATTEGRTLAMTGEKSITSEVGKAIVPVARGGELNDGLIGGGATVGVDVAESVESLKICNPGREHPETMSSTDIDIKKRNSLIFLITPVPFP